MGVEEELALLCRCYVTWIHNSKSTGGNLRVHYGDEEELREILVIFNEQRQQVSWRLTDQVTKQGYTVSFVHPQHRPACQYDVYVEGENWEMWSRVRNRFGTNFPFHRTVVYDVNLSAEGLGKKLTEDLLKTREEVERVFRLEEQIKNEA